MEETPKSISQIFIKFLNTKTLTLQFPSHSQITPQSILHQLQSQSLFYFSPNLQTLILTLNGKPLSLNSPSQIPHFSTLTLIPPLLGGKGGFGSLLRGAATKAGQKKTNNFDACRDMSGRRLRHVNAEKKMEEWKAGEEERQLEKKAEKFLKDLAKKGKTGRKDDGAEKYVAKYREDSKRCVEEVEKSVREAALGSRKRKGGDGGADAKKLKIWMGKRKMADSDSGDSDEDSESDDSDTENDKSAVTDNGSQSDSSKDASNGSISVPQSTGDQNTQGSSDSGEEEEEEEKAILPASIAKTDANLIENSIQSNGDNHMETSTADENMLEKICVSVEGTPPTVQISSDCVEVEREVRGDSECKTEITEEVVVSSIVSEIPQPLNFDDYGSAFELEVLGMERLKSELQERGLKCGGTLQERAARLFLLKTTPLEKLPKKLLAKK